MEINKQKPESKQKSALIAMSGGVDSTVAAMLALRDGYECEGATMLLHACGASGEPDARAAADRLGLPFRVFDFSEHFERHVIKKFVDSYGNGKTPNPCIDCNKHIKFGRLLDKALELGKDYIITGHYAQVEHSPGGRLLLKKGADANKDQSYVLYGLKQEQLTRVLFPLGGLSKRQVRVLALNAQMINAGNRDSQDICFIPDGDYAKFINEYTGQIPRRGRFVDVDGNDLGEHNGVICYTVGQRHGLGLAMPHPVYVLELKPQDNTVLVGKNEHLYTKTLRINEINLIPVDRLDRPIKAQVRIRYKHAEQPATVHQIGNDSMFIEFDEPQRAITKGQAAVIYDGDVVIGGGTIV